VADRIFRYNPNAKILTILRDPVERSWSHYLEMKKLGVTKSSFEKAVSEYPVILFNSLYTSNLSMFKKRFQNNLLVFSFNDLKNNEEEFIRKIYSDLGISQKFCPKIGKQNVSKVNRSFMLSKFARFVLTNLREMGYVKFASRIKTNNFLRNMMFKSNNEKNKIPESVKTQLEKYFSKEKYQLEKEYDIKF